ncbi:MAG TPA: phosphoenolpyruvate kinase, partial [Thermoanaerobaculia bacterium]|nr:phosphoenolpyruvate kinase [Thermoanaerobaculia bacterium]
MERTLPPHFLGELMAPLQRANVAFAALHPGESGRRQPVHTVYGGAHLFQADVAARLGGLALAALDEHAPDAAALARAIGLERAPESLQRTVYTRVREKLAREPVEDFRLDFEDGYGNRPDDEEDGHAVAAARQIAAGMRGGGLPPFLGIRIKPLNEELRARSVRTLDLVLGTLVREAGGLPPNFAINLAKVTIPEQVAALADLCDRFEPALGLRAGTLRCELMVETPQAIIADDGTIALPRLLAAARGRCVAAHFGTYDYTAGCNITA